MVNILQSKAMKAWHVTLEGVAYRVAMEKDTLDVWVNGDKVETAGEFTGKRRTLFMVYIIRRAMVFLRRIHN